MNGTYPNAEANGYHEQELRIALVMNGGVSLAVWIGGVTHEINRLVRGETVYGRLCKSLWIRPRVDIISGTSAGGINGALLALAMSQGKSLEPLRDIWLKNGDILKLLRQPTQDDPPSLLDGGYFYKAMLEGFREIRDQQGKGLQPPDRVPIELIITTTVLHGEVRDFPDDIGSVIQDVTHRGLIKFRRGPGIPDDPFATEDIVAKLAAAARATASFPAAFEPFYLPSAEEAASATGNAESEAVPCLIGHTDFNEKWLHGRYVVDGGVLDNNPLESAIDAAFHQRADGEVRRVLAYVVPDPGHIPNPPSQTSGHIPTLVSTALASLVSIPRVESVSEQLRAIARHNQEVARQRNTRLLVARSLDWEVADRVAESVFPGYRLHRAESAADYIATALVEGTTRHRNATGQDIVLGRRARERIANAILQLRSVPWLPDAFTFAVGEAEWQWGLFTLQNVMDVVLDLLHRSIGLVPARRSELTEALLRDLMQAQRRAYDLIDKLAVLRDYDQGYWLSRGTALAHALAEIEQGGSDIDLRGFLNTEIRGWIRLWEPEFTNHESLRPPKMFTAQAEEIGRLFLDIVPLLLDTLALNIPPRGYERFGELATFVHFLAHLPISAKDSWRRLLTLEVVHYAFGGTNTRDQFLELIQFNANVPTSFGGPDQVGQKLAGVQVAHFGAFYKRSWRMNDWMFGRLDGADRLVRILLDPSRLARLYGSEPGCLPALGTGIEAVLTFLHEAVLDGLEREDDGMLLQSRWDERLPAMRRELTFLETGDSLPGQLPECAAMVLERLHLDILRRELPALADAVGDDELDGALNTGNGSKFFKRFRSALFPDVGKLFRSSNLAGAPDISSEQLVQLFKGARVGQETILEEVGTDRFTLAATRSAAVMVSALSGKKSGLNKLRVIFVAARAPLVALDILVNALMKKGRAFIFISLYAMAMAVSATVLLAGPLADAKWHGSVTTSAGIILAVGFFVLLRRHPMLLVTLAMLTLLLWKGAPLVRNCLG